MPSVEEAVVWAVAVAEDDENGYSMPDREGDHEFDCTSLTARAFAHAGFDVDVNDYSGNMYDDFTAHGFDAIAADDLDKPSDLIRGDVLLAVGEHAAIYIGDGQLVEASWNYDGEPGDSSGREIHTGDYYDHPWDWVLRYPQDDSVNTDDWSDEDMGMECIYQPNEESYMVYYDGSKIHMLGHPDEVTAIGTVYQQTHNGKCIPIFKFGTKAAPWATRFKNAVER